MSIQFVIPSYKRAKAIGQKTVKSLREAQVPDANIWVFVASEEEKEEYQKYIPEVNLVVGKLGITPQRIFINEFFPADTRLVSLDDDVKIVQKDELKTKEFVGSFVDLAERAFNLCETLGVRFWGVPVSSNGFFMKHECIHGLRKCAGALYGEYAQDPKVQSFAPHSEDIEKQLKHVQVYGGLLRLNDLSAEQNVFAEGGVVDYVGGVDKRRELYRQVSQDLAAKYPDFVTFQEPKKATGAFEKFKNITLGRYSSLLTH
jgi:hypothetical protein